MKPKFLNDNPKIYLVAPSFGCVTEPYQTKLKASIERLKMEGADIIEGENSYLVIAEIPGVNKEDIHITFDEGEMTITAKQNVEKNKKYLIRERHPMTLKRTVSFGEIDEEKMSAKYENGLLYITILTKAPEKKEKKTITIE